MNRARPVPPGSGLMPLSGPDPAPKISHPPLRHEWPRLPVELRQAILGSVARGLDALKVPDAGT